MTLVPGLDVGLKTSYFFVSTSWTVTQKEEIAPSPSEGQICYSFPLRPFYVFETMSSFAFPHFLDSTSLSPRLFPSPLKVLSFHPFADGREQSSGSLTASFSVSVPTVMAIAPPKVTSDILSANVVTFSPSSCRLTFQRVSHHRPSPLRLFLKTHFSSITLQCPYLSPTSGCGFCSLSLFPFLLPTPLHINVLQILFLLGAGWSISFSPMTTNASLWGDFQIHR